MRVGEWKVNEFWGVVCEIFLLVDQRLKALLLG
jgi:hypothetical protein